MSQLDMFLKGSNKRNLSGLYSNLSEALYAVQMAVNTNDVVVENTVTVDASRGGGNQVVCSSLEFGKVYHVKVEVTEAFTGDTTTTVVLGTAVADDSYISAIDASGLNSDGAVIDGTSSEGTNIVVTWANTSAPDVGEFVITTKVIG